MAMIFRPVTVQWHRADGTRCAAKGRPPDAAKTTIRSEHWYARWTDRAGRRHQKNLETTSRKRALELLAEIVAREVRLSLGLDVADDRPERPLADHLEDYRRHLLAKNNTGKHVRQTVNRCLAVLEGTATRTLGELQAAVVLDWLARQREDAELPPLPAGQQEFTLGEAVTYTGANHQCVSRMARRMALPATGWGKARRYPRATVEAIQAYLARGHGVSTSNHYVTALRGFVTWLCGELELARDPLAKLKRMNADADVRVERRALPLPEFSALLDAARAGPAWRGLSGPDRGRLYLLAARTGLREGELASLTGASVDGSARTVTVEAAYSKRRRKDVLPVAPDVLEAMGPLLASAGRAGRLWPGTWADRGAEMLRADLEAAGLPYVLEGRRYDFHALRHQFISDLAAAGVHPKEAQELARHSTITLTLDRYSHADADRLRDAVGRLGK